MQKTPQPKLQNDEAESRKSQFQKLLTWLRGTDLTVEERNLCTGVLLDKLQALPLSAIISANDVGEILINGQDADIDKLRVLRESAIAMLTNQSFRLVLQQARWIAIQKGLATGLSPEELLFYRAALWFSDSMLEQLTMLAGQAQEPLL